MNRRVGGRTRAPSSVLSFEMRTRPLALCVLTAPALGAVSVAYVESDGGEAETVPAQLASFDNTTGVVRLPSSHSAPCRTPWPDPFCTPHGLTPSAHAISPTSPSPRSFRCLHAKATRAAKMRP